MPTTPRRMRRLTREESLDLLASVSMGRIVFTKDALPAVRPVNHMLDESGIVIRSHMGAAIVSHLASSTGTVVAYEADVIDPDEHVGWSVIVTGLAHIIHDPERIEHYQKVMRPWADMDMDYVIRIRPEIVTGFRLLDRAAASG